MLRFDSREIDITDLVVAGLDGRDKAAVDHHIEELAAIGVAPPSRTPLFYRGAASLLTQTPAIQVVGPDSSGEAEAVLLATDEGLYVTLGSDHTDRKAEAFSVAVSKQLCAKPLAAGLWRYEDVAPHWDQLVLRSWTHDDGARVLYQEGPLSGMLPVDTLLADYGPLTPGTAMFCGTLPAIGGLRPAPRFEMELEDPVLNRRITHTYDIESLPVVA